MNNTVDLVKVVKATLDARGGFSAPRPCAAVPQAFVNKASLLTSTRN